MDLEHLNIPKFEALEHPKVLKPAILNAKRSAALGFWLVLIPAFFLACVAIKYVIGWNRGIFQNFEQFWAVLDRDQLGFWLQFLVLLIAPLATLIINLLAVLYVEYDQTHQELKIHLKMRSANLLLAGVSILILGIFTLYAMGEYFHHQISPVRSH